MDSDPDSVVVATLTYRRPDRIRALVPVLLDQVAALERPARVVVVDNDPDGGAAAVIEPISRGPAGTGDLISYCHEPLPGIAAARNRALDAAASARFLAFIDDDEVPRDEWLVKLLDTQQATGAVAVMGPVVPSYEAPPDEWIAEGAFFVRPRRATGTRLRIGFCGNILVDLDFVRRHGIRFDARFGLSGGEDTLFTMQIDRCGGSMVWCDEAIVTDVVPADRMRAGWVLARRFSAGNTGALCGVTVEDAWSRRSIARIRYLAQGAVRSIGGLGRALAGVLLGSKRQQARGLRTAFRGFGLISGAVGYRYLEYRRPTGDRGKK